jgi:cellobiose phosphorylase
MQKISGWRFTDAQGTFHLENPQETSGLYFPLVNEAGMISAITPSLGGDLKTGHDSYLLTPTSVEDLHNSRSSRNFWVYVHGKGPWSATGVSAFQSSQKYRDQGDRVILEAGFLWHKVTRYNLELKLEAEVINYIPASSDQVELMRIRLINLSQEDITLTPTAAIPIYARSADNLHDHRHVTSLLNRIKTIPEGVTNHPALTFNERGHRPTPLTYCVLGVEASGTTPVGFFPTADDFMGEGGSLDWPEAVVNNRRNCCAAHYTIEGYEALGGLRFRDITLCAGQQINYVLVLAVIENGIAPQALISEYAIGTSFNDWLKHTQVYWEQKLKKLEFVTGDPDFDRWARWVTLQPMLRRLMGNSFLPYHDYGRGGRGWRDLWQDCLALLILEPEPVSELLFRAFAGVRMDGSNATIIGSRPGEFRADRNDISRVWMDHGAWPFLATSFYIHQSGDLEFLMRNQTYFKDPQIWRSRRKDVSWTPDQGTLQRTQAGEVYSGTILEHLLVQHLTAFFNVGRHNNIRLEGADWNDAFDMAPDRGESVAFSALYASNLLKISEFLLELERRGVQRIELGSELIGLLDLESPSSDYENVDGKISRLQAYFAACAHTLSPQKISKDTGDLAADLKAKGEWLIDHIRRDEWIENSEGYGWFNGYYDNDGQRVEGDTSHGVRMTLTGQVFTLMGGVADDDQLQRVVLSADRYLFDPEIGGYRLNTDFGEVLLNIGRCFGFAYGHKENGAMFSHMAVMYANALYRRGKTKEGFRILDGIYRHSFDFEKTRIYPGIPEYFNPKGRGLYTYLTGSASWFLLTLVQEAFGVKGVLGDLRLEPRLVPSQYNHEGKASVTTVFAGREFIVTLRNPQRLEPGQYHISDIMLDGFPASFCISGASASIKRKDLLSLPANVPHTILIDLAKIPDIGPY